MKFYIVDDGYINYLKTLESKVPDNYSGKRPYIGVVLEVDGHKYLAPLTSYKEKQDRLKSSSPTIFKLHHKSDEDEKLGMIQLNNMFPVTEKVIVELDVNSQDEHYKRLLNKQYEFIKSKESEIKKKATKLHAMIIQNKVPAFTKISCDFSLLENQYTNYTV